MSFIRLSRFLLPVSALLMLGSVAVLVYPGPVPSIEFTGGTLMELSLDTDITREELAASLARFTDNAPDVAGATILKTQSDTYLVRMQSIDNDEHAALLAHLEEDLGELTELQYTTIGPTVGASLRQRSLWALAAAIVCIVLYLAWAFRNIPRSLSPWTFGFAAIAALVHDVLITTGIFTLLSNVTTFQLDTLFVTALLSIMGYSVNDTIVIFDRIRDSLLEKGKREDLVVLAERGLRQSFSRTLNTGVGTLIMLSALLFFGSQSIRWFILALILGTVIGTYSSYFVATPLLTYWKKRS